MGRVTTVRTRKPSTGAWSNVASGIVYQPLSLNVKSFTHGNGLATTNTHTLDYELSRCRVTRPDRPSAFKRGRESAAQRVNGALALIDKSYTRADKLNIRFYPMLRAPRDRSDHRQRGAGQLARTRVQQAEPAAERGGSVGQQDVHRSLSRRRLGTARATAPPR